MAQTLYTHAVGGTVFVFGLYWLTAPSLRAAKAAAKVDARASDATHVAYRRSPVQYGLAPLERTPPWGRSWRAAAASAANINGGSWIGAFRLSPSAWWVIRVNGGRISTHGDAVYASEEDAQRAFAYHTQAGQPEWLNIYAPAAWGIAGAQPGDLTRLLSRSHAPRLVSALRRPLPVGLALAAVGVVGISVLLWNRAPPTGPAVVLPTVVPVPSLIPARALLDTCLPLLLRENARVVPGWSVAQTSCTPLGLTTRLSAGGATPLSTLSSFLPEAVIQGETRSAELVLSVEPPLPRPASLPLASHAWYAQTLGRLAETCRAKNTLSPPPSSGGQGWTTMTWTFSTPAPPSLWVEALGAVPNLVIDGMTLHGGTWDVKGMAYVAL